MGSKKCSKKIQTVTHQVYSSDKQLPGHSNQAESTGTAYSKLQLELHLQLQLHFHFHLHHYDHDDVMYRCSAA